MQILISSPVTVCNDTINNKCSKAGTTGFVLAAILHRGDTGRLNNIT